MMIRQVAAAAAMTVLAACSTGSVSETTDRGTIAAEGAGVGVSGPLGGVSAGIGVATLSIPGDTVDEAALVRPLVGRWSLARSGERACTVDLAERRGFGAWSLRTTACPSIEFARLASWQPDPNGLTLFDFEGRPVARLEAVGADLFEGQSGDGRKVTLWR